MMDQSGPAIDFTNYITKRTEDFTGREWVFQAINEWLADSNRSRFFLLKGEPGSGKTAIGARLSQFSQGLPPPNGLSRLTQGYLSAIHFCSARDTTLIDPLAFAGSLATQLANRFPAYLKLLEDLHQEKHIGIEVQQTVQQVVNGQVIGVVINVSGSSPESAFNRVVREPLKTLLSGGMNEQVVILVDALDEALSYSGTPTIVSLLARTDQLSPQVRFLLITRQDERVENQLLGVKELSISIPGDQRNQDDIRQYVAGRLQNDLQLAEKAAQVETAQVTELVEGVSRKAEGNFLYASFLLDAMAKGLRSLAELDGLPLGLDWLYFDSLRRVVELGKRDWFNEYRPLMGVLSVAQESLTLAQLQAFTKQSKSSCIEYRRNLQQFIEEVKSQGEQEAKYRLYHQSVMDFLHSEVISIKEKEGERELENTFYLPAEEWHREIVTYYCGKAPKNWGQVDNYGLKYIATHLAEAALGSEQPQQHEHSVQLMRLLLDPAFREARAGDLVGLQRDIELALRTVTADDHPLAFPFVVEAALALVDFHRERLQPEQVFDLARMGNLKAAEEQLELLTIDFAIDQEWQQAVLLTLAWLAIKQNPLDAQALCNRVSKERGNIDTLSLLFKRVEAALNGKDLREAALPPLPSTPSSGDVHAILARVGGRDAEGVLWNRGIGPIYHTAEAALMRLLGKPSYNYETISPGERPAYLAEQDSPPLVAYAIVHPERGTEYVKQYLTIHAANTYVYYRNRSLWGILDAVLRHPESDWVLKMLPIIEETEALTGRSPEFQEGLPLTILALQALAGQSYADQTLEQRKQEISHEAGQLSGQREQGDSWGSHKRRLAALAQAYSLLQGRYDIAVNLLTQALHLPQGYAGFQAPACLSLAEAIHACQVGDRVSTQEALRAAQNAAHNIQDPVFCARTTARYNALRDRWWKLAAPGFDVVSVVENFVRNPSAPSFAAIHVIGEQYNARVQGPNKLPLPPWMLEAETLEMLVQVYRRPLAEFRRLNREQNWDPAKQLPSGTQVNVPDPDFAPLLSCRFAAEALATNSLSLVQRVRLIQSLVPMTVLNLTALDSVLARLLLAARPDDSQVLKDLAQTVARYIKE